ncbi:proteasome adapter and scaffold protein ECM29-like [Pollicipes pollicipes]|uniref:proteasome adapter and scaffold protein ECM29-like n=1 Tax=Pollicipes pollicipes TaxID=41117 RepID=UPI001884BFB5|nr:proteasome adapter and scaffold protein ECM29-like [Pollicipes pollicipes]
MAPPPGTQDELALVERVFLRIGSAESDEQLENALSKFLPPVLLKLSSTQEGVRKKVMELLVHVNKRLKSRPAVKLPVDTLLLQYQDPAATSFLKNFTVIYLKMGFPRLDLAKQAELAISMLISLEDSPQSHQDPLLSMVADVLARLLSLVACLLGTVVPVTAPVTPSPARRLLSLVACLLGTVVPVAAPAAVTGGVPAGLLSLVADVLGTADFSGERARADIAALREKPAVLDLLLDFMLDLLLLPYGYPPPADRLERLKAGLVRFLAQGLLPAARVAPHLLVAMADTRFTVANLADMELKRLSDLDWEEPALIAKLCDIYLGTLVPKDKPSQAPKQELRRQPVSTRIRLKLLPYLTRSRTAATMFPQSVQVMFDSFYGTNTNPKLKLLALQLTNQIIQHSTEARLSQLGAMILGVLHSVLVEERTDARLRSAAYTAVGQLGQKLPAVITRDLSVIKVFFDAIEQEESETGQFVQDTLQLLAPSLRQLDEAQQTVMEALLTSCLERESVRVRQVAVQYWAVVFPERHAGSRLQLLLATADSKEEVAAEALKHLKILEKDVQDSSKAREFPDFAEMVNCVTKKAGEREAKKLVTTLGNSTLPFPPKAFAMMIRYLSLCLQHQASPAGPVTLELARGRAAGLSVALQAPPLSGPVQAYLRLTLVSYPREPVRLYAAELYGVVAAASLDDQPFADALRHMHQLAVSKGPLPVRAGPADQKAPPSRHYVITRLLKTATNKELASKTRERAIVACGGVCVGDPTLAFRRDIVQHFLSVSSELDELELQMAVGEAMVCAVLGPLSAEARDPWLAAADDGAAPPPAAQSYQPDELLTWLLRQLLENQLTQTHPRVRQSAGVWLLALVKHCQRQQPLRDNLAVIQNAFMELLASGNDLVQEAASKGLALVYDSGDERQRALLVDGLVGALTGTAGRPSTQKVTGDTRLFGQGELGKDPSGGQLSTYKELCSLASDLNQPDLIYKFMTLVNHNAAWNSRRGAAFGFSTIASRAGEALTPHLGNIVPKLYRYQFDPKPQVQQTMRAIWASIVPDTSKTMQQYLPQIMDEVLARLTDNLWRVRESCCAALAELLCGGGGSALEPVLHRLPEMWSTLFRVRDDIKESVRLAAHKTLEVLSRVSVRLCEQQDAPKLSQRAMALVLPALLETGLASTVSEVRSVSLSTVMKLARTAGPQLRPHLRLLVPALLEALSTLESSAVRQVSVAFGQQADTQEVIDRGRLGITKDSAMFRTLTQCIQYVDAAEAAEIVPRLSELMKRNTGLGTKCGVALFAARLATERPLVLQQTAGKVLSALVHGMQDRNVTVRRCCAAACGNVCRAARTSSVEKLITKLRAWYMDGEDETLRPVCAAALQSLSQHSPSQLKEHAADAASLAFFAMHREKTPETESEVAQWEEVWEELAPGTEGGLRLYLAEIVALCRAALAGQSWPFKAQAAAALGAAAARLSAGLPADQLLAVLDALLAGLPSRTWDGKQALLGALADVCQNCAAGVAQPEPLADAVLREAARERPDYKAHALAAAGRVLRDLSLDRFGQLWELAAPYVEGSQAGSPRPSGSGGDEEPADSAARLRLQEAAYTALGRAWPAARHTQETHWERYVGALAAAMPRSTRAHQLAIVTSLRPVTSRLWLLHEPSVERDQPRLTEAVNQLGVILALALEMPKYPSLRREALAVTQAVLSALRDLKEKLNFPVLAPVGALSVRLTPALEAARADAGHDIQASAAEATRLLTQLGQ